MSPLQEGGCGEGRQSVAGRDEDGAQRRWADRQVDRECADEHGRPHPPAKNKDRDQGDPGGGPDRGHLTVDEGQTQAEAGREPVSQRDRRQLQQDS